jgi:hypothetical protein
LDAHTPISERSSTYNYDHLFDELRRAATNWYHLVRLGSLTTSSGDPRLERIGGIEKDPPNSIGKVSKAQGVSGVHHSPMRCAIP